MSDHGHALSLGDVARLQQAQHLLLSPMDFKDTIAWRRTLCDHLIDWIQSDGVDMILPGTGESPIYGVGRWGKDQQAEYVANWHDRAEIDRLRDARGLKAWVRYDVLSEAEFRRTRYFRDFCQPIGFMNSGGAVHRFETGEKAVLHLTSSKVGMYRPGGRTFQILSLLQPALAAGATAWRAMRSPELWLRSDADAPALALVSIDGLLLHVTPRLSALLARTSVGATLQVTMASVAREAAALLREPRRAGRYTPRARVTLGPARIEVSATMMERLTPTGAPMCLVLVRVVGERTPHGSESRASLTGRELEVARLLARGCRNTDIAAALGVSDHTARRHTERVLRKLGIRSRAGVAVALADYGDVTPPS